MNQAYLLNSLWMWQCRRETRALWRSTRKVEDAQLRVLRKIVSANHDTDFGRAHQFQRIDDEHSFQRHVPPSDYDDYDTYVERIAAGEKKVLTAEPVRLLEPTSGTTRAEKLIPYTDGLRRQFQRGVAAWIGDLLYQRPGIRRGRAYWSISPAMDRERSTPGGVPVGFDDDTAYLSGLQRRLVKRLLAVPPEVARQTNLDNFRYQTLLHLLSAPDLALISIWSPTFLSALFSDISCWSERLTHDVRHGRSGLLPAAARADELERVFATDQTLGEKLRQIWPRLDTVSCWADAVAGAALPQAKRLLPQAEFQAKGLIATEAFVTLPLVGLAGGALAVRSHFFEFEQVDVMTGAESLQTVSDSNSNAMLLAHQLQPGRFYRVLVTTAGGLYRYHLHDIVEVVGFLNQCPRLRLLGKSNLYSDLVGEKLNEGHVRQAVDRALQAAGASADFSILVPRGDSQPGYCLYLQGLNSCLPDRSRHKISLPEIALRLDGGLSENPYYRQALDLGQLAPVQIFLLHDGESAASIYLREMAQRGFRLGDVKPVALDAWSGWSNIFDAYIEREAIEFS
ncbi:MAG: GH3 auxin-responsive promoter family protein [Pirellulales bacterium]|nr:GH3 auxin-responsive promoter family protein [Pirellulales bacterium]